MPRQRKRKDATEPTAGVPELVPARATINLPGLPRGRLALVDPKVPYIKQALKAGYLIRESPVTRSPTIAGTGTGK